MNGRQNVTSHIENLFVYYDFFGPCAEVFELLHRYRQKHVHVLFNAGEIVLLQSRGMLPSRYT